MTEKIIGTLVRHALTGIGGVGLVSGSDLEQVVGATSVIISVIWSIIQKKNQPTIEAPKTSK